MSDGGISAGYGEHATGTTGSHHDGHADTAGLHQDVAPFPEGEAPESYADPSGAQPEGLDRLYARMEEVSQQQQQWIEALANAGVPMEEDYEDDYGDGYEDEYGEEPADGEDVLDDLDQVLSDAVTRRMDAAEQAEEAEALIAERDVDFEDLREQLPMLQDGRAAQAIVDRACNLCVSWGRPDMIQSPELVKVIQMVALASLSEPGLLAPPVPRQVAQTPGAPQGLYQSPPAVQLESAAGAGGASQRAHRPPTDQEQFMAYVQDTQKERV